MYGVVTGVPRTRRYPAASDWAPQSYNTWLEIQVELTFPEGKRKIGVDLLAVITKNSNSNII
jgi:hypothetical protein